MANCLLWDKKYPWLRIIWQVGYNYWFKLKVGALQSDFLSLNPSSTPIFIKLLLYLFFENLYIFLAA